MQTAHQIKSGTTKATIMPLLKDVLKANLFVKGCIAKPIFKDSIKTGALDPIAAIAVLYIDNKPVAWAVRTCDTWRTGCDDTEPRTENEIWWRYTTPEYRGHGFCTSLKSALTNL